jgi:predicted metal-binding membrane protein
MLIMVNLWSHCLEIVRRTNGIFPLSCIAVFSTWMILGVFTIQPTSFPLIFIFALISSGIYTVRRRVTIQQVNIRFAAAE